MSAGGVFKILTNDGKADQMLMATQLLKDRICDIIDARTAAGLKDTLPTLKDLEKTHVLHFQSKFKPFVALGYEYQKVKAQSGTTQLGGSVTFSIPQFGDFLSDMVLNVTLSEASYNAASVTLSSSGLPSDVPTGFNLTSSAFNPSSSTPLTYTLSDGRIIQNFEVTSNGDKRVVVRRLAHKDWVDADGNAVSGSPSLADRAFYCDYPGERLMKKVSFDVNGNPLDDYDAMSYAFHRKFRLTKDKLVAYNRNMGQQVAVEAYDQLALGGQRKLTSVVSGPQTPQLQQPKLNMWIKLLFWFNLDHSQSLVSAAIPYGQRFINIDLASIDDLLGRAPAAWQRLILSTDTFDYSTSIALDGTSSAGKTTGSSSEVVYVPKYSNGTLLKTPKIDAFDLYVNNIFTIPEVHDIYIERIGFSLIRVHRIQREGVNSTTKDILLSQFKYPVEFFYCGLRPDENVSSSSKKYTDWHRFSITSANFITSNATTVPSGDVTAATTVISRVSEPLIVPTSTRTIGKVSVTAHGVALYNTIDSSFFNQYIPEVYGGRSMIAPEDQGVLFVNFCLHPYSMQPSGHINTSRAREFFIKLEDIVLGSSSSSSTFLAEASALNFLLVSDGTAVLRYTT